MAARGRCNRGADRLADDGFTRVHPVVDGFVGDMGKDAPGRANGCMNANLHGSATLDKAALYPAH